MPLLLSLAASCSQDVPAPGQGVYGFYSNDFAIWTYKSNPIQDEIGSLRADYRLNPQNASLVARLQALARRQTDFNDEFRGMSVPPAELRSYYEGILQAMAAYDQATAAVRGGELPAPLGPLVEMLASEQRLLLERVTGCYARLESCR